MQSLHRFRNNQLYRKISNDKKSLKFQVILVLTLQICEPYVSEDLLRKISSNLFFVNKFLRAPKKLLFKNIYF